MQKGHNFWQCRDHNSRRRYENKTTDPIFFICFSTPNCLGASFLHLKIVKVHILGSPLVHSGLHNTWILEVKAVRLGFCPVRFRKYTCWEKWKTRFCFFYRVENIFQNFYDSWSKLGEYGSLVSMLAHFHKMLIQVNQTLKGDMLFQACTQLGISQKKNKHSSSKHNKTWINHLCK